MWLILYGMAFTIDVIKTVIVIMKVLPCAIIGKTTKILWQNGGTVTTMSAMVNQWQ